MSERFGEGIWHSRPVITDPVGWFAHHLPLAIEFAEREIAATERAREANIQRMRERGICFVGHRLDLDEIPANSLGTAPCGYCASAREGVHHG